MDEQTEKTEVGSEESGVAVNGANDHLVGPLDDWQDCDCL